MEISGVVMHSWFVTLFVTFRRRPYCKIELEEGQRSNSLQRVVMRETNADDNGAHSLWQPYYNAYNKCDLDALKQMHRRYRRRKRSRVPARSRRRRSISPRT